ncbi:unnamed protein product [Enterobius vermicularis]|uniref:Uncharacterized protein n=1 Tax=Enterobius vermicularis TaxID=51028 RepID=A0A3P6HML3_ENTVE|nr:unnamed protein product [Enterobius vermicularis]
MYTFGCRPTTQFPPKPANISRIPPQQQQQLGRHRQPSLRHSHQQHHQHNHYCNHHHHHYCHHHHQHHHHHSVTSFLTHSKIHKNSPSDCWIAGRMQRKKEGKTLTTVIYTITVSPR